MLPYILPDTHHHSTHTHTGCSHALCQNQICNAFLCPRIVYMIGDIPALYNFKSTKYTDWPIKYWACANSYPMVSKNQTILS